MAAVFVARPGQAQDEKKAPNDPLLKIYRATFPRVNNLVHTKLDVRFDYKKRYLYGKEWVTLRPHAYPTDSLRLDAKGMNINTVAMVINGKNSPLKFTYDSLTLSIKLDKSYTSTDTYTVYIDYTAKPDELKVEGSAAISDAKGLYFVNPDSTEAGKPVQIWTQGETEGSSAWFPTIDKPNQKTTQEISMTVPGKYVTLSNGRLVNQRKNADATRTDTWKMDLPHAPYLFMMAVGDFRITRDKWRGKDVSYFLEPAYAPYAKEIFGFTPEVIEFYSKTLGVDYPWNKYDQIVVRDYVSGAMENTTATLHGEYVQKTARELLDAPYDAGQSTIVHELFHQWFGDYVTAESWSNLTVNESFANFSEVLWAEHKYGKDAGDAHNYKDMQAYLNSPDAAAKNLVRFHYHDKEDMFDVVTYQKGGRILNMLRNYLGNDVFYKGLNTYLKTNALKTGEAQQLRLALEEASGKDLNWFFNQWYYGAGHPLLTINYDWNDATKTQSVYLQQTQPGDAFILPMAIDLYAGGKKERHQVWMRSKSDTLTFTSATKPDLVNVDADKVLLMRKNDNKSFADYAFQFTHAPLYLDRFEAITAATTQQGGQPGRDVLLAALKDPFYGLRLRAISAMNLKNDDLRKAALPALESLAQSDKNTLVRAAALNALAKLPEPGNKTLFTQGLTSPSYAVQGAALNGLAKTDSALTMGKAKALEKDSKGALTQALINLYAQQGTDANWPYVYENFKAMGTQNQFDILPKFTGMVGRLNSVDAVRQGIDLLKDLGEKYKKYGVGPYVVSMLNTIKGQRSKQNDTASVQLAEQAITAINAK
ncbi:MAG: M1 family metallopeptidase [Spirosoma sp.]|nr:M1 family metallopeptidase [Spirosoma sp.]